MRLVHYLSPPVLVRSNDRSSLFWSACARGHCTLPLVLACQTVAKYLGPGVSAAEDPSASRCFVSRKRREMVACHGGRRAAVCAVLLGRRYPNVSSRFTFWPEAISSASALPLSRRLSLNLLMPWKSLASANRGSTHTRLLRKAFSYGNVSR